jgi:hypothetical protein
LDEVRYDDLKYKKVNTLCDKIIVDEGTKQKVIRHMAETEFEVV